MPTADYQRLVMPIGEAICTQRIPWFWPGRRARRSEEGERPDSILRRLVTELQADIPAVARPSWKTCERWKPREWSSVRARWVRGAPDAGRGRPGSRGRGFGPGRGRSRRAFVSPTL